MTKPSPQQPGYTQRLMLADRWKDYQLLDTGGGLKLERWGDAVLVRPDPQIIWPRSDGGKWDGWDGWYHRSETGGGRWEFRRALPESWTMGYGDLTFKIRPTDFKHTGLFPEQAVNWDWCAQKIRDAGRTVSVLNLFGYTGAATVACAAAGAEVCHVDASKGVVQWCRDNAALSGHAAAPIRYITDDCLKFTAREARRGRRYDAIILDPPAYGRGPDGEKWVLEEHLNELLKACADLLDRDNRFFIINLYSLGFSSLILDNLMRQVFGSPSGAEWGELYLDDRYQKRLPLGVFYRFSSV